MNLIIFNNSESGRGEPHMGNSTTSSNRNQARQLHRHSYFFTHGGPRLPPMAVLDNRIQYWTQRGFAVCRSELSWQSVGFGRGAYRHRLKGHGCGRC